MKIRRVALYVVSTVLLLLVGLRLGAYAKDGWDTFRLSREFATAHPQVMRLPAVKRMHYKMRKILDNLKETRYSHFATVDESKGIYLCDCSLLGGFIVRSVAPEAYRALPVELLQWRPRAKGFQRAIATAPTEGGSHGWLRIPNFMEARPGDIIAWGSWDAPLWANSGHVMLVLESPVAEGGRTARVRVLDASDGRHAEDSRGPGENGVGTGMMWFSLDSAGAPVAFHWDCLAKAAHNTSIVVGRVVDTL